MKKFTNLQKNDIKTENPNNTNIKFKGQYINIIDYKNYEIVSESDMVVILPYLVDEAAILLRSEFIPTYQYFYKNYPNVTNFLTVMSGQVEENEQLKNTVRRELYEESGIVLSSMYDIEIDKSLFLSKGNVARYHVCILELRYNDFKITTPPTDGSKEEAKSQTLRINISDIEQLRTHDLITDYMLQKFKLEYLSKSK